MKIRDKAIKDKSNGSLYGFIEDNEEDEGEDSDVDESSKDKNTKKLVIPSDQVLELWHKITIREYASGLLPIYTTEYFKHRASYTN